VLLSVSATVIGLIGKVPIDIAEPTINPQARSAGIVQMSCIDSPNTLYLCQL
jgi:hypothetical protein